MRSEKVWCRRLQVTNDSIGSGPFLAGGEIVGLAPSRTIAPTILHCNTFISSGLILG